MHEYSIVDELLDSASRRAHSAGATEVTRLCLSIGELSGVDAGLLRKAFETFRERTICEHAELVIVGVPAAWQCRSCGAEIRRGSLLACRRCGGAASLARGGEILLDRIEMEVPDV